VETSFSFIPLSLSQLQIKLQFSHKLQTFNCATSLAVAFICCHGIRTLDSLKKIRVCTNKRNPLLRLPTSKGALSRVEMND